MIINRSGKAIDGAKKSDRKIGYIIIIIILFLSIVLFFLYHSYYNKNVISGVRSYLVEIYRIERGFVENIPIYEDFASPEREKNLRKFLLYAHINAAMRYGIQPVQDDVGIKKLVQAGKLVKLKSGPETLYYFYNVKKSYRYLTPEASQGLEKVASRFQENLNKRKKLPPVKIAISSVIRPVSYQSKLVKKNFNATIISTHCYGISFDIFYDDFFIKLPESDKSNRVSYIIQEQLRRRLGFLLGDSLRRQFRSVLMETLLQLQEEGVLYAILESRQRCYHITILKK